MAHFKSPHVTPLEASPATIAPAKRDTTEKVGTGTVEFTPTALDTLALIRVPSTAVLNKLILGFDDNGGTITIDCGFYEVGDPGAVIDQNALVTLLDTSTAALAMADLRFETKGIETNGQQMWELAGLSTEPDFNQMDIALTVVTGTTPAAGTVSYQIEYSV